MVKYHISKMEIRFATINPIEIMVGIYLHHRGRLL